jgi:hypothetical protein
MKQGALTVLLGTGLISAVTAATREGLVPLRTLAATPGSVAEGRLWLLVTSAVVADRPALPSILGFAVVGLAAVLLCGSRVVWSAAAVGHLWSAAAVYAAVELAHERSVLGYLDYGTSAIVAAWVGAIAFLLWRSRRRLAAVALCLASALLGWYFEGTLTVLDTEHAVALALGAAVAAYGARGADAAARRRISAVRGAAVRA